MKTNNMIRQNIFSSSAVARLMFELRNEKKFSNYLEDDISFTEGEVLDSTIELPGEKPELHIDITNPSSTDLENAILIHSYYKGIDNTQASDSRLWTYLSHIEFRKYTMLRWGLKYSKDELSSDEKKQESAIQQILDHWFVSAGDRDLRRHSIARLWWSVRLTHAPWISDPEFFSNLRNDDPYYYTRVLMSTQDIYQQLLERSMGRSNRILILILDYLDKNKEFAKSRENIRGLMKELNLMYGTKKIINLNRAQLESLISSIASSLS